MAGSILVALRKDIVAEARPGRALGAAGALALAGGLLLSALGFPSGTLLALVGYCAVMTWVGKRAAFPRVVAVRSVPVTETVGTSQGAILREAR